ncbi:hypothetical protein ZWY2020_039367 [Hordeum vulgare]|nr:hypothetical protein ZWY2020_039367 [Hordeum vulgare]
MRVRPHPASRDPPRTRARVVLAGNIDLLTRATSNFLEEGFIHGVAVPAPPSPARRTAHVMSFKPGAVLEDAAEWQAPNYCFAAGNDDLASELDDGLEDACFIPKIRMPIFFFQNWQNCTTKREV